VSAAPPTVSVVLRTYDHARYVAQAIESVLIQEAPFPFELVIGEDCSTDGTREIVASYAARHPDVIRAVLPDRNLGHGAIFERALEATRAPFIAYLDGDDYWTSASKLRRQVDFLRANPECASCFHDVSLVYGESGVPSGAVSPKLAEARFSLADILLECFVPAPAVMFRREVVERLPDWTFEVMWIDWLIHICSATLGSIGYVPATLGAYRVHSGGMFSALDRITQVEADLPFYERLLEELPEQRERIERCVAYRHCELAIERLGVPFDACVVLIDPGREMRPYFNGRHARSLPRRDARAVTELEAIRDAAATLSTADRDYESPIQPIEGRGGCHVVVPAYATEWVAANRLLVEYLEEEARVAWRDEWCAVHELAPRSTTDRLPPPVRVAASISRPLPDGLLGGFFEAPSADAPQPAHVVPICGWVLGRESPVVSVEFEVDGRRLWRAPVELARPDVGEAFPEHGEATPGFETTLNLLEAPPGAAVDAVAVLSGGERLPFARLEPSPVPAEAAGAPAG
jgi:glycosyltransferase involved in cell wall biosynthesis